MQVNHGGEQKITYPKFVWSGGRTTQRDKCDLEQNKKKKRKKKERTCRKLSSPEKAIAYKERSFIYLFLIKAEICPEYLRILWKINMENELETTLSLRGLIVGIQKRKIGQYRIEEYVPWVLFCSSSLFGVIILRIGVGGEYPSKTTILF